MTLQFRIRPIHDSDGTLEQRRCQLVSDGRARRLSQIGVVADRIEDRAIVIVTLDNLVKGSAGQAIQNMNLMFDWPETTGLEQIALFP